MLNDEQTAALGEMELLLQELDTDMLIALLRVVTEELDSRG